MKNLNHTISFAFLAVSICNPGSASENVFSLRQNNGWYYKLPSGVETSAIVIQDGRVMDSVGGVASMTSEFSIVNIPPLTQSLTGLAVTIAGYDVTLSFAQPLPMLWYPLRVGDKRTSNSDFNGDISGYQFTGHTKAQVEVVGREILDLPIGKLNAYKIKSRVSARAAGFTKTLNGYKWFVPNLGIVATGLSASVNKAATIFQIFFQNGLVNSTSDNDNDGVLDWKELVSGTNWQSQDSDADGATDDLDNCPLNSNPDQLDDDGDHVGNVCDNQTRQGKLRSGVLVNQATPNRDTVAATLIGCDGLLDAIYQLPSDNTSNNIVVTIGDTEYTNLKANDLVINKGIYTLVFARDAVSGKPVATATLNPNTDAVTLKGNKLNLTTLVNPIKLRVELGGWACESSKEWRTSQDNTHFNAPPLPL